MKKCFECEHWKQLSYDGEDVCLATEDENGRCYVIPVDETDNTPDFCPLSG